MIADPETQIDFLVKVQRVLSEGAFVSTYKFALLIALADLSVERGDDTTEVLHLDTVDLAAGERASSALPFARTSPAYAPRPTRPQGRGSSTAPTL